MRFLQNSQEELEKTGQFFQVAIHFHHIHPQTKMTGIDINSCTLVGLFLTKLNHYFIVSIDTHVFLLLKMTLKIGDTDPLITEARNELFKDKTG